MSGHSRWANPETMKLPIDEHMVQYVQGYIMAMEDILQDIENASRSSDSTRDYEMGHRHALEDLKRQTEESRESARRTLDMIIKKLDRAE
jgi:hypothetical protein